MNTVMDLKTPEAVRDCMSVVEKQKKQNKIGPRLGEAICLLLEDKLLDMEYAQAQGRKAQ